LTFAAFITRVRANCVNSYCSTLSDCGSGCNFCCGNGVGYCSADPCSGGNSTPAPSFYEAQASIGHPSIEQTPFYEVQGSIDVDTLENSIFYFHGVLYLLENIGCGYAEHAGKWFPDFEGHSYARIRELKTGHVVSNISSSIGFAFISAFPDYKHDRVWLFGINFDRCHGTHKGNYVNSWWSSDLVVWDNAPAVQNYSTYNTEVSAVDLAPKGMESHAFVMILEPFGFLINNDPTGNLTAFGAGWLKPSTGTAAPKSAPSGGPSIRFSNGYYYIFTGGRNVELYRSQDLLNWAASPFNPLIKPSAADANVAPLAGFNQSFEEKGFGPMHDCPTCWDLNSNDGDVCCMTEELNESWLVWGASTQGGKPKPPVMHGSTNAVGHATMPLSQLLEKYFS